MTPEEEITQYAESLKKMFYHVPLTNGSATSKHDSMDLAVSSVSAMKHELKTYHNGLVSRIRLEFLDKVIDELENMKSK